MAPGDKQRQKEALIAKAAKYFPHSYGPGAGTSFVIEEIGEVSEDEDDYGVYQKDRLELIYGENDIWGMGNSKLDVYHTDRFARKKDNSPVEEKE